MSEVVDKLDKKRYAKDITYTNNPRIKKVGVKIPMTQADLEEYAKCASSAEYFIENYLWAITLDHGLTKIHLWDFQKDVINEYQNERKVIFKCPRQAGKTTITVGFILWFVLFQEHKTVGVLAQKESTAKEILSRIKLAYQYVPKWMQQGVVAWNEKRIDLENGSKILSEATASGAIRGFTINLLYLDEFAHIPTNIAESFYTSVYPTISSGTTSKIIITSTPKGLNLFYKFWTQAQNEIKDPDNWNGYRPMEAHWRQVPGRDQAWADDQRRSLGSEAMYNQEVECEFLGSSHTLISGKKLRELVFRQAEDYMLDEKLMVYERPQMGHSYVLAADPSEGTGLDYHAMAIVDVTSAPYKISAKFRDNNIDPLLFASYIKLVAEHYNNAYVIAENNNNGPLVLHELINELEYDNVFYSMTTRDSADITAVQGAKAKVPGLKTTGRTKSTGCNKLKILIENDQLIIEDFDIISELSTFVLGKNKKFAADEGAHDDTVATLWLFAWLSSQPIFKEISDLNLRAKLHAERMEKMTELMPPVPIIQDQKNNKPMPFEKSEDGTLWLDSSMGLDEALEILNSWNADNPAN